MDIWEITGDDLRVFLNEMTDPDTIRVVRVAIDDGALRVKVNEYGWTYGLGTRKPSR
jgi:hypothetical protein